MLAPGKLPPLPALRTFEAAARLGSYTRAAEELHVTHSAVSHQVRALEEQLGFALFTRQGRAVVLTPVAEPGKGLVKAVIRAVVEQVGLHVGRDLTLGHAGAHFPGNGFGAVVGEALRLPEAVEFCHGVVHGGGHVAMFNGARGDAIEQFGPPQCCHPHIHCEEKRSSL